MKNLICCCLSFLLVQFVHAQNIPNGDFENWIDRTSVSLAHFNVLGDVQQTTDRTEGNFAIKLTNTKTPGSDDNFGLLANAQISSNLNGGHPYDEAPLSFRFDAKYDLAIGEAAQLVAALKLNGNIIATAQIFLEGNSGDTFTRFSVPINYQISAIPDTVIILASSKDLEEDTIVGNGYVILDDMHFASFTTRDKALMNGGFELWDTAKRPVPDEWTTTDDFLAGFGLGFDSKSVTKVSGREQGSAVMMKSVPLSRSENVAGIVGTAKNVEGFERPNFPVDRNWKYMRGHYKYNNGGADSAYIAIGMFKAGVPIAFEAFTIGDNANNWTEFSIPIQYLAPQIIADSATVILASANPDEVKSASSVLTVDDLMFSDNGLGYVDLNKNRLKIFPNPVEDVITWEGIKFSEEVQFQIIDGQGKVCQEGILDNNKIQCSELKPGVYWLNLNGKEIRTSKMILKK